MRRVVSYVIDRVLIAVMVLLMLHAFNLSMKGYEGPLHVMNRLKSPFEEIISALK